MMSTPFICRRCVARTTQSQIKKAKPKHLQLRTQATSTSVPLPTRASPEEERQEYLARYDSTADHKTQIYTSQPVLDSQKSQDEPTTEQKSQWDGKLRKYSRFRRTHVSPVASEPPATTPRRLKEKILRLSLNYDIVNDDLRYMYGLSHKEALHAVDQLKRLLWGLHSRLEAGARVDLYHVWKSHFGRLLNRSHLTTRASRTLPTKQDLEVVKDTWHRLDQSKREDSWPQIIISAFHSSPSLLPSLIQTTFHPSLCPSYIVEDLVYLLFLTLDGIQDSGPDAQNRRQQIPELVSFILKNCPPRFLVFDQMVVRKIMPLLPTFQLVELYEDLRKIEHPLQPNTLLHFASRFARESKFKVQAAEVVHSVSRMPGFDINSPAAASVCTSLLTLEEGGRLPDDHAAPDELFKMLLDVGLRPNILNLSALMRNFCVRGHVEVAWNIFDNLIQRGIEPDTHVFSILLSGSKRTLDTEFLQRIVNVIEAHRAWSPYLVNDILDFIYQYNESRIERRRRQRKSSGAVAWRLMVQVYAKFFDLAPLQKLTLFPLENILVREVTDKPQHRLTEVNQLAASLRQRSDALLMQPDTVTLELMVRAHLRTFRSPRRLQSYYRYFMELLRKRNPTMVKLIEDRKTAVHDIFLQDLIQFKVALKSGIRMVDRMCANAGWEKKELGENILYPPPSVHTYTILMSGLKKHRRSRGVISVLNTMIEAGITPDIATWNVVIGTLLQIDHMKEAVMVMRYLEHIGLGSDDRTVREVTRLSGARSKRVAELMTMSRRRSIKFGNQGELAKSLLSIWDKKGDDERVNQTSLKAARQINTASVRRQLERMEAASDNNVEREADTASSF
ncbi:hypothetical protein F4677DRAFT_433664 [Hypoxylon crocopeplum]|nr:hypothetical protein F4677DRAFT_433664 [Hypoxylon crocopeplum]